MNVLNLFLQFREKVWTDFEEIGFKERGFSIDPVWLKVFFCSVAEEFRKKANRERGRGNGQTANAMARVVDAIGLTSKPNASQKSFRNDLTIVLEAMTYGSVDVLMSDDNRFISVMVTPQVVFESFSYMAEAFLQATMVKIKSAVSVIDSEAIKI